MGSVQPAFADKRAALRIALDVEREVSACQVAKKAVIGFVAFENRARRCWRRSPMAS